MTKKYVSSHVFSRKSQKTSGNSSSIFKLSVFAAAAILSQSAAAQNPTNEEEADNTIELKDTYVRPDYVEIERMRDTKEIIVIPKEDIQDHGNRTISDVLKSVPGISVNASGPGDIDIRGQGQDQAARNIQVLLDGAPITTLINHPYSTNYDVIPVEQLERIEIIPGGGSVIYGSGTVGGVVNITSNLRSMKEPKSTAVAELNSDGFRLSGTVGAKLNDKFSILASANKLDRDLWFVNTYRNSEYYSAGLGWNLTDDQNLILRVSKLKEESQYVNTASLRNIKKYGKDYVPADSPSLEIGPNGELISSVKSGYLIGDRDMDTYNISYSNHINDKFDLTSDFFFVKGNFKNNNDDSDHVVYQETYGGKVKLDINYYDSHSLLVGLDVTKQTADLSYNDIGSYRDNGHTVWYHKPLAFYYDKKVYAGYLLNTLKFDQFVFTQGIRRELAEWGFDKIGNNVKGADVGNRWNTALEVSGAWLYRDTGRIYARYERGFTLPDGQRITDMRRTASGERYYTPTDATDEKYDMFEIGLRDKLPWSTVNITLWMSKTDNQLNRFYINGFREAISANILETTRWGADVGLTQHFGKFTFSENYSWLRGYSDYNDWGRRFMEEQRKNIIDYTRSGLVKVPQHSVSLLARYDFNEHLSADVKYSFFGGYNNFLEDAAKQEDGTVGAYSLVDVSARWKPFKHFEVYGGVTNLLDKQYYEYVGSGNSAAYTYVNPGMGRTYFIGIRGTY